MTSQRKNTDIKLANTCTGQVQTVRVEGCSTSGQLQLSAGNTGGWEEFEEEVDRALDRALERELDGEAERSRRQTIRSVQEERRTQMIEDNRLSSIARGKNFPHNPQLHGQPSNFRTSKPTSTNQRRQKKRRKIRVRNELIILDGVELSALTQFDLAASAIISPTSLGGLVEGKNVHMAYHLWTAVKKTLDDDILMDSFRDINLRDDARTWGLLSDCVFEQMIVELGTANTDRLAVTDSKERRRKEIFLFIDPRKSNDASAIVRSARRISALFLHKNRRDESEQEIELFISIPATQQGIQASHELEKTGIKTNLTQVASLEHARICETYARVSCVTMDIGSIQKWFERREKHRMTRDLAQDLAIDKVREIARHLRAGPGRSVTVKVLGENFRTNWKKYTENSGGRMTLTPRFFFSVAEIIERGLILIV
ncbi:hypothetical protein L218DRAFT_382710 [Marasmius fiardii PR-910]|nr:hypothetical protein L218DRAFT_382710 [Marasmius fiardii PR-910]